MEYADEMPDTDNPTMVIGVAAKCTICETAERCDGAVEAKQWARDHQHPRDLVEFRRRWAER
ncbi:hypothetical protein BRD03_10225 [Halobacteriales archaeon QS_9_68_17]|nr:MAG: hypothetical protein BRD03_10225 [Halobacteriales archaeon QS_9_68_17]